MFSEAFHAVRTLLVLNDKRDDEGLLKVLILLSNASAHGLPDHTSDFDPLGMGLRIDEASVYELDVIQPLDLLQTKGEQFVRLPGQRDERRSLVPTTPPTTADDRFFADGRGDVSCLVSPEALYTFIAQRVSRDTRPANTTDETRTAATSMPKSINKKTQTIDDNKKTKTAPRLKLTKEHTILPVNHGYCFRNTGGHVEVDSTTHRGLEGQGRDSIPNEEDCNALRLRLFWPTHEMVHTKKTEIRPQKQQLARTGER